MSFDVISIALSIFGVIGIGGAIALFFLAPAIFALVMQRIETGLTAVLSTRVGCAILAGVACFILADQVRSFRDGARCETAIAELVAKAETAREQRDADAKAAVEAKYTPIIADLQKQSEQLQTQVSDYEKQIVAATAGGVCVLGNDGLKLRKPAQKPAKPARRGFAKPGV